MYILHLKKCDFESKSYDHIRTFFSSKARITYKESLRLQFFKVMSTIKLSCLTSGLQSTFWRKCHTPIPSHPTHTHEESKSKKHQNKRKLKKSLSIHFKSSSDSTPSPPGTLFSPGWLGNGGEKKESPK